MGLNIFLSLFISVILSILVSILVTFALLSLTFTRYQTTKVFSQLRRYPANERWLALSNDLYDKLQQSRYFEDFNRLYQRDGFGLVVVSSRSHAKIICEPTKLNSQKPPVDYLRFYEKEDYIRRLLQE